MTELLHLFENTCMYDIVSIHRPILCTHMFSRKQFKGRGDHVGGV